MIIIFGGLGAAIILMCYIVVWMIVGMAYILFGCALVVAFVTLGVWGLVCSLVLGVTRGIRARSASELRRGLRDGWLFGIAQSHNMSKTAKSVQIKNPGPRDWTPKNPR